MSESVLIQESIRLRQTLRKSCFGTKEVFKLYLGTPVTHLFIKDNPSGSDISLGYYGNNKKKMVCL